MFSKQMINTLFKQKHEKPKIKNISSGNFKNVFKAYVFLMLFKTVFQTNAQTRGTKNLMCVKTVSKHILKFVLKHIFKFVSKMFQTCFQRLREKTLKTKRKKQKQTTTRQLFQPLFNNKKLENVSEFCSANKSKEYECRGDNDATSRCDSTM